MMPCLAGYLGTTQAAYRSFLQPVWGRPVIAMARKGKNRQTMTGRLRVLQQYNPNTASTPTRLVSSKCSCREAERLAAAFFACPAGHWRLADSILEAFFGLEGLEFQHP